MILKVSESQKHFSELSNSSKNLKLKKVSWELSGYILFLFFVRFLKDSRIPKIAFEIYWPLRYLIRLRNCLLLLTNPFSPFVKKKKSIRWKEKNPPDKIFFHNLDNHNNKILLLHIFQYNKIDDWIYLGLIILWEFSKLWSFY